MRTIGLIGSGYVADVLQTVHNARYSRSLPGEVH
jgi:hypothetical protein